MATPEPSSNILLEKPKHKKTNTFLIIIPIVIVLVIFGIFYFG